MKSNFARSKSFGIGGQWSELRLRCEMNDELLLREGEDDGRSSGGGCCSSFAAAHPVPIRAPRPCLRSSAAEEKEPSEFDPPPLQLPPRSIRREEASVEPDSARWRRCSRALGRGWRSSCAPWVEDLARGGGSGRPAASHLARSVEDGGARARCGWRTSRAAEAAAVEDGARRPPPPPDVLALFPIRAPPPRGLEELQGAA
ncbi:unnamed protein product [Urochloa humidicola]